MTRESWDINAKEWSRRTRLDTDLSRKHILIPEFIQLFKELGGNDVLDAGSGAADVGSILQQHCDARVVEVDYSIEMCRQAVSRSGIANPVICGDISRLPFSDHSFDTIVANMVLGSVNDLEGCCAEFSRVLRPRGILIFSVLHPARVVPTDISEIVHNEEAREVPASVIKVKDYLNERRINSYLKLGGCGWLPSSVEYYHRPLSRYSATLLHNGLITLSLHEPLAAQDIQDRYPMMAHFWRMAPFLVWVARKEPSNLQ